MIDQFFLNSEIVNVEAATVGISAKRWESIPADVAREEAARRKMKKQGFDVLPVSPDESGAVDSYFVTETWGDFHSICHRTISYDDTLPFREDIRRVIEKLAADDRNFFFLEQDQQVVGLLTVSNLNCRAVRVFLYGLLAEMETGLAKVIENSLVEGRLNEEHIHEQMSGHLLSRYQEAKEDGVDESITEYLYLSDLKTIIGGHDLYMPLGYNEQEKFERDFEEVNEFRNSIAHPVRTLKGAEGSPASMWKNIETCERALFHLHNSQSRTS